MGAESRSESFGREGRTPPNPAAFSYYQRLELVRLYVLQHLKEPITLADVAKVARMERTAFSSFFHRATGMCFRDWLSAVRITRAMRLMEWRNLSVKAVGIEVGYPKVRSFERAFLRVTGQRPIEYKMSVRPR